MQVYRDLEITEERLFHKAVDSDDLAEFLRLLSKHNDVAKWGRMGKVPILAYVAGRGKLDFVNVLLEQGASAKANETGDDSINMITPLSSAISRGYIDIVERFLELGADPNDSRCLISAINAANSLAIAKLLVNHGLDIHKTFPWPDGTIENGLSFAIAMGKQDVVDYLRSLGARMPEQPAKKPSKRGSNTTDVDQKIIDHFRKHFGKPKPLAVQQIVPTGPEVSVHVVPPSRKLRCVTLFTVGMSREPLPVRPGEEEFRFAELFMQLPPTWPHGQDALHDESSAWPFSWLRQVAQYPHASQSPLGGPLTIIANDEPPQPLASGLKFTCLMLLAEREVEDNQRGRIRLYRCLPLYTAERDFERQHDAGALLRAFDDAGVSFVHDPERKCVV